MNHRDRFYATIKHQPVDRPASWLGLPVPAAEPELMKYFGVNTIDQVREVIDDDIYPIEVPYNYPPSNHIACAFDFAKIEHLDSPNERTLTAPGFFEDYSELCPIPFRRARQAIVDSLLRGRQSCGALCEARKRRCGSEDEPAGS